MDAPAKLLQSHGYRHGNGWRIRERVAKFDAKLAGELADNVNVTSSELKLNFSVRDRDSDILDGEGIMDAVIVPQAALENGA